MLVGVSFTHNLNNKADNPNLKGVGADGGKPPNRTAHKK